MISVRFHGRGGQGAVTAGNILATALMKDGKYAQSFPLFGGERRGTPVMAFVRADEKQIRIRSEIEEPDCVVVLDATLIKATKVDQGLRDGGWLVINSREEPDTFDFSSKFHVAVVNASSIAVKHGLGSSQYPAVNTAILGSLVKVAGLVNLETLLEAIRDEAPVGKEKNADAAREAYLAVKVRSE